MHTRVLYDAAPGRSIQTLGGSSDWIAWFEGARSDGSDDRLYALPTSGGSPIQIDDFAQHGKLAVLPDLAVDGSWLYWTVPQSTATGWLGSLERINMETKARSVAVGPTPGKVIAWPSARDGALAYELATEKTTPMSRVVLRAPDGSERLIEQAPASEPTLGDGFVVSSARSGSPMATSPRCS
jgi:hypothetical protein